MKMRFFAIAVCICFLFGAMIVCGCKKPSYRLNKGIKGVNDLIVLATEAPDNIAIYSVNRARIERTLPSDERLNDMEVDKEGKYAYVVTKNGWLNVFNLQRGDRRDRVHVGDLLQSVAISGDGKYLAVGVGNEEDYNAKDVSIRPTDNIRQEIIRLNLRGDIQDIVANPNPDIPELYFVNTNADKIRVFNFKTMEFAGIIVLGGSPSTFAISPDGKKAYATLNARNIISVIDIATQSNLVRYDVIGAPHYIAFSRDGKQAVVTDREKSIVYFIDNENDELIGYKEFHPDLANVVKPELIAFSNDASYLYVISGGVRELMVIDIRTMQMVQNHSLPKRPSVMHVLWGSAKA